jgi:hypothetical protein
MFSQSCVESAISTVMSGFGNGDTYTLTIHQGGIFGGVTVCVSSSLN